VIVTRTATEVDIGLTFGPVAHTMGWATSRIVDGEWRHAMHTPAGAVTFALRLDRDVRAWGPGCDWLREQRDSMVVEIEPFAAPHPLLARLQHRLQQMRLVALGSVTDLAPARIIGQRVTTVEERRSWRKLVYRYGERAPGPFDLRLPPAPSVLAELPDWEWKRIGVEGQRAGTIRRFAREATRCDAAAATGSEQLTQRLRSIRGIGPWTSEFLVHYACADADAVPTGDWHMPTHVPYALAGERGTRRATDERMLELLEPYRPQRAVAWRMIMAGGPTPPRRAPRQRILGLLDLERTRGYA
jgi:3-methyladenine DNA glycosylase/8-oxoguanine DNA glycosylase